MSTDIKDDGVSHLNTEEVPDLDEGFFQECDKEHDTWSGKDMDVTDILARIRETGGVNQDIAIQMESLEPGILESRHLTHLHFTRDYTRTNLTLSQEALEDMSQGAKIAIAVGVGTFVAALVAWILSKVFGEGEDGGGGGGGGSGGGGSGIKDRNLDGRKKLLCEDWRSTESLLKEIASVEKELNDKLKAIAEESGWDKLLAETGAGKKDFTLDNAVNQIYRKHLAKHYCVLVSDLINKPTPHASLAHHLVTNLPKWIRELSSLQNQLFHNEQKGEIDESKFALKVAMPAGLPFSDLGMLKAMEHYREISIPDKKLPFPEFTHIEHANFLESIIKDIDRNQESLLKDMQGELEAFVTVLKTSAEENARKTKALNALRNSYREVGMCYQLLVLMTNRCDAFLKDLESARTEKTTFLTQTADKMIKVSETPEQKSALQTFKEKVKAALKIK